ncbi:hypothetical protein EDC90_10301, partial [Martelella mediterranea]
MSKSEFWKEMDDVRAAMLGIGSARHVPMSPLDFPFKSGGLLLDKTDRRLGIEAARIYRRVQT